MDYVIGGVVIWLWLSIGFGTRAVFRLAGHHAADFFLLPIVWPIALLIAAYDTNFSS